MQLRLMILHYISLDATAEHSKYMHLYISISSQIEVPIYKIGLENRDIIGCHCFPISYLLNEKLEQGDCCI